MWKHRILAMTTLAIACVAALPAAWAQDEGLKVRGHWTIDVRQPDGTLVSRHEFDNALVLTTSNQSRGGDLLLVSMLGRTMTMSTRSPWVVFLGTLGATLVLSEAAADFPVTVPADQTSTNLAVRVLPTPPRLELAGSIAAPADASITNVSTALWPCQGTDPACATVPSRAVLFTRHVLATPIAVLQGQIVQVTVRISFS
jgi:hypothetical protein